MRAKFNVTALDILCANMRRAIVTVSLFARFDLLKVLEP